MGKALILLFIVLLLSAGCSSSVSENGEVDLQEIETDETEAIVAFTEAALQIEIQRDEIATYYAELHPYIANSLAGSYRREVEPLLNDLVLLDCPQSLEVIKDSLVRVYDMEIEATETGYDVHVGTPGESKVWSFYPEINMDNVDSALELLDPLRLTYANKWIKAQQLRKETYATWGEILAEYDLMPPEIAKILEKVKAS